jgi:hypothetical protein
VTELRPDVEPNGVLEIVVDYWSEIHVLTHNNPAFARRDLTELVFPALAGNFIRAYKPQCPKVTP